MYIKLTRMDGSPIWLNAAFVVTIEPHRKSGGSLVVPIGDGLDYEVKEAPETVLAMLDGAPVPTVVPIPSSDALTAAPDDVSPEENIPEEKPSSPEDDASLDVFKPQKTSGEKTKQPKKTTNRRSRSKTVKTEDDGEDQSQSTKKKSPARSRSKKKHELQLEETELERLRKLAPKTLKKLGNTISTQFKVEDVKETIEALSANGIIAIDGERVVWANCANPEDKVS
jgi:hypothetical protein